MDREQDLHRGAAARQLETLERIEEGHRDSDGEGALASINEGYIPMQAPADAGAGTFRRD